MPRRGRPQGGSTLPALLPVAPARAGQRSAVSAPLSWYSADRQPLRVLIVDDEPLGVAVDEIAHITARRVYAELQRWGGGT